MPRRRPPTDPLPDDEPCYVISIASRLVGLHQQTLRYYERAGFIRPHRTGGNIRMYSNADIHRIRQAQRLIEELGVNLAGVEVVLAHERSAAHPPGRTRRGARGARRSPPERASGARHRQRGASRPLTRHVPPTPQDPAHAGQEE